MPLAKKRVRLRFNSTRVSRLPPGPHITPGRRCAPIAAMHPARIKTQTCGVFGMRTAPTLGQEADVDVSDNTYSGFAAQHAESPRSMRGQKMPALQISSGSRCMQSASLSCQARHAGFRSCRIRHGGTDACRVPGVSRRACARETGPEARVPLDKIMDAYDRLHGSFDLGDEWDGSYRIATLSGSQLECGKEE